MAKQFIIAGIEEVFGEYILNMSKENLRISALRGNIKLENVQLDGDLIGSHVLGAVGLAGFGVLSCSAKSIKISVPWKNLEKEPTRFELRGVHLVCVPLTPSTAHKMYGSGTKVDPRCTLRTRAKRLVLARFERNFWNGQIPGEGPPMKRIKRAVREVARDMKRSMRRKDAMNRASASSEEAELGEVLDNLVFELSEQGEEKSSKVGSASSTLPTEETLPELPRDWKVKLREKVLRNLEASMFDIHIRCEVAEGGLDLSYPSLFGRSTSRQGQKPAEERAFALGFTMESFVMRTANEKWEAGSHDKKNPVDGSAMSSEKGHLGPNEYVVKNNKIGYFNKVSMYWDDEPPLLLSETDAMQGNYHRTSPEKLHTYVAAAMEAMFYKQEPGHIIRQTLAAPSPAGVSVEKRHQYVCESLQAEVRARASDRTRPGPISASADVLPFNFTFHIRPHQYLQYHQLRNAIKSQQRFDTMLRQRPSSRPNADPRSWWKYAIACVIARPNWRPWVDIRRIVKCRRRYIELVTKKNKKSGDGNGYHAGLSDSESAELLSLEDLLPIEALLAFHLLALRRFYDLQKKSDGSFDAVIASSPQRGRTKGAIPFRLLRSPGSARRRKSTGHTALDDEPMTTKLLQESLELEGSLDDESTSASISLLDAMTLRLGTKVWFVDWRLHDASVNVLLRRDWDESILLHLLLRASGNARSFGKGKTDFFFDIRQCDTIYGLDKVLFARPNVDTHGKDEKYDSLWRISRSKKRNITAGDPDLETPSNVLNLPPSGTLCRIVAGKNMSQFKLSVSAHPATFVCTPSLFDDLSEFFFGHSSDRQTNLTEHIRNAATPLARKAQLALLSPASVALYLNIAAPKIWMPIVSRQDEGALFLDAGTIKLRSTKEEGDTVRSWDVTARDIQVNFVRGLSLSRLAHDAYWLSLSHAGAIDAIARNETSIILPFSVEARSHKVDSFPKNGKRVSFDDPIRQIEVRITPVCLSLVDAETLARAFGELYSRGLGRVSRRSSTGGRGLGEIPIDLTERKKSKGLESTPLRNINVPRLLRLTAERVEVALEGHSKTFAKISDDKSLTSLDTFQDHSPSTRTYLVEVLEISVESSRLGLMENTQMTISDASIIRLKEGAHSAGFRVGKDSMVDSDYCILTRAFKHDDETAGAMNWTAMDNREFRPPILRASLLHDGNLHLDELEIDIDSVVLRVTPTTLKDSAKAFRRIVELAQLMTKEMERKAHEEGRRARRRDRRGVDTDASISDGHITYMTDRSVSPVLSEAMSEATTVERRSNKLPSDSSVLVKVTLNDSTLLAGRPTTMQTSADHERATKFAVIQILSNALIMFQSIENADASGSKTLHISVDNVSSLVTTEFRRLSPSRATPMIGPTGAEFRVVYATEKFGCVVSQAVSLDCEAIKACLTPNDLMIVINVSRKMVDRMAAFGSVRNSSSRRSNGVRPFSSLIRYQKKGTGIATQVRAEVHSCSFVLLRAFKSQFGAPEFLEFKIGQVKGKLGGCMSALSGDFSATFAARSFVAEIGDWDDVIESFPLNLGVEQMPNDLVLHLSPSSSIQVNFTGILLRDFAEMKFDVLRDRFGADSNETAALTPSVLSTIGLRRATESRVVNVSNSSGLDLHIVPDSSAFSLDSGFLKAGSTVILPRTAILNDSELTLSLRIASSSIPDVGERLPVYDLPLTGAPRRLYVLKPATLQSAELQRNQLGRSSPETIVTESPAKDFAYYLAEPVVEWCMHNQRMRSTTSDVYSLPKGRDLLSSITWSPEDEVNQETPYKSSDGARSVSDQVPPSPDRLQSSAKISQHKSNWIRPYLKDDAHEWSDMTFCLRLARERVMLPDSNWMWVNDWIVDISGDLGTDTDADGWEYAADFETFTAKRRFYERGDSCRRRRWTRTRIMKPPRLDDPLRQLKFVWETAREENGNVSITVRSSLKIKNNSSRHLAFFVYSPSWDEEKYVGAAVSGQSVYVPASLASAVYMRLARKVGSTESTSLSDFVSSNRFMILPTSPDSSSYFTIPLDLQDVSGTTLHFILNIRNDRGIVDIFVDPILKIVNLLPCQLECQIGESHNKTRSKATNSITKAETFKVSSGKQGDCIAVSPWNKPHVSLRVPGYRWSKWHRIVNRKANSFTWRPHESEEDWLFHSKGDADFAEELKTLVRFERTGKVGDPLVLLLSVECGHTPTIRIYSQYWILDKSGFGCRFSEGFQDMMGTIPDAESSRRSHLLPDEAKNPDIIHDTSIPGHQWSIGMEGMSLFFSRRERLALCIEAGPLASRRKEMFRSKWIAPLDISNVIPKTVFSVEELGGTRKFELAISVTVCPGIFVRTKMITLLPRYHIVNLLHRELLVAQDGSLDAPVRIPSQSSRPFHWEKGLHPPKVRLCTPSLEKEVAGDKSQVWTNGSIRLDRVGITSLRVPTLEATLPMVVQAEVRLATKEQSSAIVVVLWTANEKSNPLYMLRNRSRYTILCRQPLLEDHVVQQSTEPSLLDIDGCTDRVRRNGGYECGNEIGPMLGTWFGLDPIEEFIWVLRPNDVACFGFDDPEKPHILEWTSVDGDDLSFNQVGKKALVEVDAMGSSSVLANENGQMRCHIRAEYSAKVIEFEDCFPSLVSFSKPGGEAASPLRMRGAEYQQRLELEGIYVDDRPEADDEDVAFSFRLVLPKLSISVVDNADPKKHGREILVGHFEHLCAVFSQSREGYHEFEVRLRSVQVDNHVARSIHPVLLFCPRGDEMEPFLHMSAVRRLQQQSNTFVFRYAAFRILEVEIFLDRRTAETIARFIEPLTTQITEDSEDRPDWLSKLMTTMKKEFDRPDRRAPIDLEKIVQTANSGRIYFEQLHLHPVRIGLTFTQEWIEWNSDSETWMLFQFLRGMASIANAPLVFTSFVVAHVFESPQALIRVIATHYSSQLTKQIFGILGSLAILGAPADFISNVGTGVRDFFYEPIQGAVHGPRQFIEGLEAGTQSLARGVFVGVVRGAANVTEVVNSNLAGLTADDEFIDERRAHQRMLTDAMSRDARRTFGDSLYLAGASIARGLKSGALGIIEQPAIYASKHGPVGFVKGIGKAILGAVVKPVVGLGDAAVLVMNHMSDATSKKQVVPKIPKRLRRALPSRTTDKPNCVRLEPYDERAAKAQKIVTGGETVQDVYIGHINIPSHLIIASEECLWAIDRRSREPWCVNWEEISHFGMMDRGVRIVVFSQTGLKTYVFQVDDPSQSDQLHKLLSMQLEKMANVSELNSSLVTAEPESLSRHQIPGVKARQVSHVFGSCNNVRTRLATSVKDEIDLVEQCFSRVNQMSSDSSTYFKTLDEEAWALVSSWGQVFSGLSSRRCIVAGVINGTGNPIQIKSTKLIEGGSPCYTIPTSEFDTEQGILHVGGVIIFFGWGDVPNLLQAGNVFMHVETNTFVGELAHVKSRATYAKAMPGYRVGFLEKSYDDSGWWAKYWLLIRAEL